MNTRGFERILIPIYLAAEAFILILIKLPVSLPDGNAENGLMFFSIVLNALVALCWFISYATAEDRRINLIPLALLFTVFGDLFLTLLGEPYLTVGVICFCIVETIYAVYLKSPLGSIVLRIVILIGLCIGAVLTKNISVLNVASVVNIAILTGNVFDAWRAKKKDPGLLFQLGITLFFCCDLSLGLSVLLPGTAGRIFAFLIWLFYIPSQVLITLSYVRQCRTSGMI